MQLFEFPEETLHEKLFGWKCNSKHFHVASCITPMLKFGFTEYTQIIQHHCPKRLRYFLFALSGSSIGNLSIIHILIFLNNFSSFFFLIFLGGHFCPHTFSLYPFFGILLFCFESFPSTLYCYFYFRPWKLGKILSIFFSIIGRVSFIKLSWLRLIL